MVIVTVIIYPSASAQFSFVTTDAKPAERPFKTLGRRDQRAHEKGEEREWEGMRRIMPLSPEVVQIMGDS